MPTPKPPPTRTRKRQRQAWARKRAKPEAVRREASEIADALKAHRDGKRAIGHSGDGGDDGKGDTT